MKIEFSRTARTSPETIGGLKVPYAPAKREAPQWRWYLIIAAVASPAILLAFGMLGGLATRSAQGSVMLDQLEVRALAAGRVHEIAVELGSAVTTDAALVTTQSLHDVRADSAPALATGSAVAGMVEELGLRERMLAIARERRNAVANLVDNGAATRAELREAEYALDQAAAAELQVRRGLVASRQAPTAAAAPLGAESRDVVVNRAPITGKVLDVFVTPGEIVRAGDALLLIGRNESPKVVAYVPPDFATRVTPGSPATIFFADGSSARASVTEPARVTRRMPADLVDSFGMRPMMVVLKLGTAMPWPQSQAIHGMPVSIRFHYQWENGFGGPLAGRMLDALVGAP